MASSSCCRFVNISDGLLHKAPYELNGIYVKAVVDLATNRFHSPQNTTEPNDLCAYGDCPRTNGGCWGMWIG